MQPVLDTNNCQPFILDEVLKIAFYPSAISYKSPIAGLSKFWNIFCCTQKKNALTDLIQEHSLKINNTIIKSELKTLCIKKMMVPTFCFLPAARASKEDFKIIKNIQETVFESYRTSESKIGLTNIEKIFIIDENDINTLITNASVLLSKEPNPVLRFIPNNTAAILKRLNGNSHPSADKIRQLLVREKDHRPIL